MPLSLAISIMEHADPEQFVTQGGAMICPLSVLEDHEYELPQKLWFLNKRMEPIALTQVSSKHAHCKVLELVVTSLELSGAHGALQKGRSTEEWYKKVQEYIGQWVDVCLAEKRRQMNIGDQSLWPKLPEPWPLITVYDMPIVLWMSKAK